MVPMLAERLQSIQTHKYKTLTKPQREHYYEFPNHSWRKTY